MTFGQSGDTKSKEAAATTAVSEEGPVGHGPETVPAVVVSEPQD